MVSLGDRVRAERLRLGLSVRAAAQKGGISNTWWGRFEDGDQPLTPAIAAAVSKAFKWAKDWAVSLPSTGPGQPESQLEALTARIDGQLAELRADLHAQKQYLAVLATEFARLQAGIEAAAIASLAAHQEQANDTQSREEHK